MTDFQRITSWKVCVDGVACSLIKMLAISLTKSILDCIIEALANPEKERLKLDDTNISEWLKSK